MSKVFLKKKQQVNEDDVAVHDPNIAMQMAQIDKQIADAEKQFNDKKNTLLQQKAMLQKKDAEELKASQTQTANTEDASAGQATNEAFNYAFRKALRLSKKLYEEKKDVVSLGREIKDKLDDLELSYTMDLSQCKKLARKVDGVLDDNFDKDNSDNKWPTIEREIKKYFKRADDVNYSNAEKGQVLDTIKDILKNKPEYDWVFGKSHDELEKTIKDNID